MPRMNHVWSLSCLKNNVGTIREYKESRYSFVTHTCRIFQCMLAWRNSKMPITMWTSHR